MKKILSILSLLLIVACFTSTAQETQDTTSIWLIETKDDNKYMGNILYINEEEIALETKNLGLIKVPKKQVENMRKVDPQRIIKGQLWGENLQATRYFWAPNGYGLKKGEGYYQNVWVFFNQVSVGLSDNFSIGMGLVPLFLFGGGPTPIWFTPKFSIPISKDKFHIGGGALIGTVVGEESLFGIAYGVTTFGSRDKNVTIGLGYGFVGEGWAEAPMISVSSMIRTGKRGYFITENYFLSLGGATYVFLSAGGRTVWDKISLDYGFVSPLSEDLDTFIAIPWLGISIPLGKKR